ncbi:hypothetical protein HaLaN_08743, partial [Haematococcus lacustris]
LARKKITQSPPLAQLSAPPPCPSTARAVAGATAGRMAANLSLRLRVEAQDPGGKRRGRGPLETKKAGRTYGRANRNEYSEHDSSNDDN